MKSSSATLRPVVLDANLAVAAALPLPYSAVCLEAISSWAEEDRRLLAPSFWVAEAVSGIRKIVYLRQSDAETAERAIDDLFQLGVEVVPLEPDLCKAALSWAARLTQSKAYDGFYLALAEEREAELWTMDGRLVRRAHQVGAVWVHHLAG
jgi:predicted nucleic acid-binding protein